MTEGETEDMVSCYYGNMHVLVTIETYIHTKVIVSRRWVFLTTHCKIIVIKHSLACFSKLNKIQIISLRRKLMKTVSKDIYMFLRCLFYTSPFER